jgi:hypothetical protein
MDPFCLTLTLLDDSTVELTTHGVEATRTRVAALTKDGYSYLLENGQQRVVPVKYIDCNPPFQR